MVQPKYVIVIGKGVANIVGRKLKFPHETIALPTAHQPQEELLQDYRRYSEICNAIISGKTVPPRLLSNKVSIVPKFTPVVCSAESQRVVNQRLNRLGYSNMSRNEWSKGDRIVWVVTSKDFGSRVRVTWKERWADGYAVIFDYSPAGGPICIIPIEALFEAKFIREKRNTDAYANSGYWWTQTFPEGHELPRFALGYKDRWDLL